MLKEIAVQAETALAAQQDASSRAYPPPMPQSGSSNETTTWSNSIPSVTTFSSSEISQFFQHSSNYPPATQSSLQQTNPFPLNDQVVWDISNMMTQDFPEACRTDESFAFGGEGIDYSDRGNSSESSSQWAGLSSSSSSDQMTTNSLSNTRNDEYAAVPQNVINDL